MFLESSRGRIRTPAGCNVSPPRVPKTTAIIAPLRGANDIRGLIL
jgi:hypothetical protein